MNFDLKIKRNFVNSYGRWIKVIDYRSRALGPRTCYGKKLDIYFFRSLISKHTVLRPKHYDQVYLPQLCYKYIKFKWFRFNSTEYYCSSAIFTSVAFFFPFNFPKFFFTKVRELWKRQVHQHFGTILNP